MQHKTNRLFLGTFIAMAVLGAALLLSIPGLFGPSGSSRLWLTGILGAVTLLLAGTVLGMRLSERRFPERRGHNGHGPRR